MKYFLLLLTLFVFNIGYAQKKKAKTSAEWTFKIADYYIVTNGMEYTMRIYNDTCNRVWVIDKQGDSNFVAEKFKTGLVIYDTAKYITAMQKLLQTMIESSNHLRKQYDKSQELNRKLGKAMAHAYNNFNFSRKAGTVKVYQ